LKIPNAAFRFKPAEPSTNQTLVARLLAKIGLGSETKAPATNAAPATAAGSTNKVETAESAPAPLTGNEPPEVLMRRVREMRERGEEPPPEIRAKLRELFQSGALQRSGAGGPSARGGSGSRSGSPPAWRTLYVLATNTPPEGGGLALVPRPVRVKTGVADTSTSYTEIIEGLQEGDLVITAVKMPSAQAATAPAGTSPFGGPRFR
jgi:hypothetical protein